MKSTSKEYLSNYKPYLWIAVSAIVGFLPVSFMVFSLKNDITALDYPIKYFISQCLHNNISPLWFNTWAMGFPLESFITWSIFSPLQFIFSILFEYNFYTLHLEFICYIILAGINMFYFLEKNVATNRNANTILAIGYMLSGFTVGSSQWMTYITAAAFVPLVLSGFISLLKNPSLKSSLLFVAFFYIMLTSAYPAFTIILSYILIGFLVYFFAKSFFTDKFYLRQRKLYIYLTISVLLMIVLYSISIYSSFGVLENIDRGQPIVSNNLFFNSNYLSPAGLTTLLLPFSSTRFPVFNSEGTMTDCYIGLLPMLLLPFSIIRNVKQRAVFNFCTLFIAIGFLLLSFGSLTPLRGVANMLPGFSYFRNPALFRLFFLLFFLMYVGLSSPSIYLEVKTGSKLLNRSFTVTMFFLFSAFLLVIFFTAPLLNISQNFLSVKSLLKNITYGDTLFASALLQLVLSIFIFVFYRKKKTRLLFTTLIADLVLNCLLCTPFFTVSSYSVKETNERIFKSVSGFPVQSTYISNVPTSYNFGNASWFNVNIYGKQVSAQTSYFGPLVLKSFVPTPYKKQNNLYDHLLLFSNNAKTSVTLLEQLPNKMSAQIHASATDHIFFLQNYYVGWQAYFNNKRIPIQKGQGYMKVTVVGKGKLEFRYEKKWLYVYAIVTNAIILSIVLFFLLRKIYLNQTFNSSRPIT